LEKKDPHKEGIWVRLNFAKTSSVF